MDPQVVTGSHDTTIKFWDLVAGIILFSISISYFYNIKKFNLPKGEFLHNMLSQQRTIINSMAVNEDGVLATAGMLNLYVVNSWKSQLHFFEGDNGSLWFWDWKSGHNFQQAQTIVQPG
ncbi:hypothetical protein GW17_00040310 [Ensete ventricosum]|uniref:Uncharacterized protein n=1 Tax=Ensete ventricosum TaxID=4639 RepID=A0A444DFP1_ENSVE|nr:hypothetical protein B296_00004385 [Ensete ventricosum]RWV96933.1 hypothetical protein GW17_00040310 [Ensete ventricosum]